MIDLLDYCSGPDAEGCEFIYEETSDNPRHLGHCPSCRIVIEEYEIEEERANPPDRKPTDGMKGTTHYG